MSQYYRTELAEFKDDNLDFLIDDLDLITKRDDKDNLLTSGEVPRFSDEATDDPIYSTMVEIEIQFLTDDNPDLDPTSFQYALTQSALTISWTDSDINA